LEDQEKLAAEQAPSEAQANPEAANVCGPNTFPYIVRPGDTMFSIARQFGVSLDALIAANPQIPDPSQIRPGQVVCIPRQSTTCPPGTFSYTVQPGDTMFSIAQRFGVSLDALIAANPQIPNPNLIFPGQIVCVPRTDGRCPSGTFAYTVQPGDSMFLIAQRFGVSLNALIAANPQIPNPNLIFPGQIVCVPIVSQPPGGCPAGTFAYTVRPGDTMFNIARRFGVSLDDLIRANPQIPNPNQIRPGQIVCVPTR
jgi:spore coat assembly protein SafA